MNEPGVERRLAAVMLADVVGYSRLMGADEEGTLAALKQIYREVINPSISEHKGRVVKTIGDGVLAEFLSVLEAMRCAVEVQRDLIARGTPDSPDPEETRLSFRIGVNLGDVIFDDGDIFGDGVNVAARLESMADTDGIAISGSVYEQVHNRLDVGYDDLGEVSLKNIAEPVHVYRVRLDGGSETRSRPYAGRGNAAGRIIVALAIVAVAGLSALWFFSRPPEATLRKTSVEKMAYPLPEQPSIAVLPFENLSGDAGQAHLGVGLTENIISSLSNTPKMFVVGRNSVVRYRDGSAKVEQVAAELGVRYVLAGGLQKSGDRLRITVQLIDALNGRHLWSERYNRQTKDIFALQDEITLNVMTALQVELTEGEMARVRRRGTNNLEAWLLINQSIDYFQRLTREDNAKGKDLARRAIELDPKYPDAYVRLARAYLAEYQAGWVPDRAAAFKRSVELTKTALSLDSDYPVAYNLLGSISLYVGRHDDALAYARKAVNLSPSYASAKASLGMNETYAGQPRNAIATLLSAMRLSPYYPDWFLKELGRAYFQAGEFDRAIASLQQHLKRNPEGGEAQILLAAAHAAMGRESDARESMRVFLGSHPQYTLKQYADGEYYRNREDLDRVLAALRKAGMPE